MRKNRPKPTGSALLMAAALCLLSHPAWSAPDYAMQMDKAATSMLLDIAKAGDRLVAVGERGHILYSDDKGESWVQAAVPTSVMLTRVFFASPKLGWAVGHDGNVLFSQDGGVNWEVQRDGITAQAQVNEERAGRAKERVAALYEQVKNAPEEDQAARSEALEEAARDLDKARKALDEPVYAPPLMDVWFSSAEQGWASGAYGTLLHTHNAGRHWDDWSHKVDNPDEMHLNGVRGAPDGSLYLASEWGTVFRSLSDGESWEPVESGYDGSFFGVVVNPLSGSVFAYGLLGNVYRSTDRGETWEKLEAGAGASLFGGVATDDGSVIFVGQGSTAVRSQDDGDTFTPLAKPSRAGFHGIVPLGDGRYVVTGDGGSRVLANTSGQSATNGETPQ
ncbi:MAG: photosystem I reaction center subunit IV [Gammaproteobacteria bacterium]|nr:photosystem I reaction center subunit IV [Gammaproteobacteria bacterium]MBK9665573.1 photosystem I reaction center subunit IV [Gammaproteobacteria bacterium]